MKKRNVTLFLIAGISSLALMSYKTGPALNGYDCTGAETGLGNPTGCSGASCHGTSATTGIAIAIEVDSTGGVPVTQYAPGLTYTIKITGTNNTANILPKYGFQVCAIKGTVAAPTPVNAGTLQSAGLPAGVAYRPASPGNYVANIVEHSSPLNPATGTGGNGTTYVQSFTWTAPAAGTGSVSVWAVLNAVNNDNNNSNADKWNTNHVALTEIVVAGPAPVAAFSVSDDTICQNSCISFTDQSTNTPTSWAWTFPGAATTSSSSQNPNNICYNTAGTYTVTLTASNANGPGTHTHVIKVNPLPTATITAAGLVLSVPNTFTSYQWYKNATLLPSATSNTYTATANGTYYVRVTNANGCSNNSDTVTISHVGVQNVNNSQNTVGLYPNPNDGTFTVSGMTGLTEANVMVQVTDATGRIVKSATVPVNNGMFDQLIKLDNSLPKGFYIVRFTSATQRYVMPFEKK